jgi:hypothetical protein
MTNPASVFKSKLPLFFISSKILFKHSSFSNSLLVILSFVARFESPHKIILISSVLVEQRAFDNLGSRSKASNY